MPKPSTCLVCHYVTSLSPSGPTLGQVPITFPTRIKASLLPVGVFARGGAGVTAPSPSPGLWVKTTGQGLEGAAAPQRFPGHRYLGFYLVQVFFTHLQALKCRDQIICFYFNVQILLAQLNKTTTTKKHETPQPPVLFPCCVCSSAKQLKLHFQPWEGLFPAINR